MKKLKVIIPAAGSASRLGIPYSKEIMRIEDGKSLIDNVFDLFSDYQRQHVEFVVVINENKSDIIKYLANYKNKYNISFCYQNPDFKEYTGAIKSASHLFGDYNVVLLPDSLIKFNGDFLPTVIDALDKSDVTFLYKKEDDDSMKSTKGALLVDQDQNILDYYDKPKDSSRYNSYWCSFAFRRHAFDKFISFMESSTLRDNSIKFNIQDTPLYMSKGIEVEDYIDLGTWKEINKFIKNRSLP
jgi:NDP-sugar pyrophosphorylase family protein